MNVFLPWRHVKYLKAFWNSLLWQTQKESKSYVKKDISVRMYKAFKLVKRNGVEKDNMWIFCKPSNRSNPDGASACVNVFCTKTGHKTRTKVPVHILSLATRSGCWSKYLTFVMLIKLSCKQKEISQTSMFYIFRVVYYKRTQYHNTLFILGFTAMKLCYTNISVCANLPFRDTRSRVGVPLMYSPPVVCLRKTSFSWS